MNICMYVCMYVLYEYIRVCLHLCVYACMYICMYVCIHVCICVIFKLGFEGNCPSWEGELSGSIVWGKCPGKKCPFPQISNSAVNMDLDLLPTPSKLHVRLVKTKRRLDIAELFQWCISNMHSLSNFLCRDYVIRLCFVGSKKFTSCSRNIL